MKILGFGWQAFALLATISALLLHSELGFSQELGRRRNTGGGGVVLSQNPNGASNANQHPGERVLVTVGANDFAQAQQQQQQQQPLQQQQQQRQLLAGNQVVDDYEDDEASVVGGLLEWLGRKKQKKEEKKRRRRPWVQPLPLPLPPPILPPPPIMPHPLPTPPPPQPFYPHPLPHPQPHPHPHHHPHHHKHQQPKHIHIHISNHHGKKHGGGGGGHKKGGYEDYHDGHYEHEGGHHDKFFHGKHAWPLLSHHFNLDPDYYWALYGGGDHNGHGDDFGADGYESRPVAKFAGERAKQTTQRPADRVDSAPKAAVVAAPPKASPQAQRSWSVWG